MTNFCMAEVPDPEIIVYKKTPEADLEMTILRPDPELTKKNKKGTPTILYFFGGGFKNGTIEQLRPQAEALRDEGMIAILVDYRVNATHNVFPNKGIEDARTAMRYVRENAKKLGVNPKMIACSGASAGGHITASLAFVDAFNDQNDNLKISAVPNAIILICPGLDSSPEIQSEASLFRKIEGYEENWRNFSPVHNIKKGAPPAILLIGDKDELVNFSTVTAFEKEMESVGADFKLFVYEGGTHTFFNKRGNGGKYFRLTMVDTIDFLKRLGYIK